MTAEEYLLDLPEEPNKRMERFIWPIEWFGLEVHLNSFRWVNGIADDQTVQLLIEAPIGCLCHLCKHELERTGTLEPGLARWIGAAVNSGSPNVAMIIEATGTNLRIYEPQVQAVPA